MSRYVDENGFPLDDDCESEKTLSDNEIIKALECCPKAITMGDCEKLGCPALKKEGCYYACCSDEDAFGDLLMTDALSLINRQKAEIERLTAKNEDIATQFRYLDIECERLEKLCEKLEVERTETQASMTTVMLRDMELALETAKSEAIKEFEDKLKDQFDRYGVDYTAYAIVDDVAREMESDSNAD